MIPEQINKDVNLLKNEFENITIHDGNPVIVVIEDFHLPQRYIIDSTKLLIKIPISYPNGKLDMFWVEENAIPDGKKLPFSQTFETILGVKWLRYSWHPQNWNPNSDNLLTFIEFVMDGLRRVVTQ